MKVITFISTKNVELSRKLWKIIKKITKFYNFLTKKRENSKKLWKNLENMPRSHSPKNGEKKSPRRGAKQPMGRRPPLTNKLCFQFVLGLYFKTMGLYEGIVPHNPEHNPWKYDSFILQLVRGCAVDCTIPRK